MPAVAGTGYQHTLSDLREHVYANLMQEQSASHFTKPRVNKWINQVFDKMRLAKLYTLASDTFTSGDQQQTWVPPADVWKLVAITYDWGGIDTPLRLITHNQFNSYTGGDWDEQSGNPVWWHDDGSFIWFDKKMPVGKVLQYWYWNRSQEITTDAELSGYYKVFLPVVVQGVLAQAKLSDEKFQAYSAYRQEFKELIEKAREHVSELHETDQREHQIMDHHGFVDDTRHY